MKFTKYGIPILSDVEKAEALVYCIKNNAVEDTMGHILDLFYRMKQKPVYHQFDVTTLFNDKMTSFFVEETKGSTLEG